MNRYLVSLPLLIWSLALSLYAQPMQPVKPPAVISPPPDVAALGKYGSIPVGLHTGVPNIDIPLYTIKSGSLELPLSLSYHASGNKVSEVASWVGLGWILNGGGVVSRSVVGKDDETGFWQNTVKSAQQVNFSNDYGYLKLIADNTQDGESDYYFYNFNGRSGKFVYKQNLGNSVPQLIPESPLKITFATGFQIIDEKGTVYKFQTAESMGSSESGGSYAAAYHLTEMVSADGKDHIYFSYAADNNYMELGWSYTETIGQRCPGGFNAPINGFQERGSTAANRSVSSLRLTEINYATGKVEFVADLTRLDLPPIRLNEIKISAKNTNGTFRHVKSFILGEDYFGPNGSGKDAYRLKLANLSEKDPNGVTSKVHTFNYDESIPFPNRQSLAQDWWGFYNGQSGNYTLIASENINFFSTGYVVGGANRSPNANAMQVGILKKITYPTGGATEFDYEPHYYRGGIAVTPQSVPASSGALGNTTSLLEQTVPFTPNTSGWARVSTRCSNVTDPTPFFSYVGIKKQNDTQYLLEHRYDPAIYTPYNPELVKEFLIFLIAGNTYELTVRSKGTSTSTNYSGGAFSSATVSWDEKTSSTSSMAGGLRVKEIRDYPSPGAPAIVKIYKYGAAESGFGDLLVPPDALSSSKQEVNFIYTEVAQQGVYCTEACRGKKLMITGRPAYDLSMLSGSPVVYGEVAVYEGSTTAPNGKQIVKFDVEIDQFTNASIAYNNGRFQLNDSWKGGDEISNVTYLGNTTVKVRESVKANAVLKQSTTTGTKVGWAFSFEGCGFPQFAGNTTCCNDVFFYVFDYPMYSGVKKLMSTKDIEYSSTDPTKFYEQLVNYSYDNLTNNHQQLSKRVTLDSDGSSVSTKYWYPADYTSIDTIQTLLSKNIVASVVKEESYRNNQMIGGNVTRFDPDGKPLKVYQYESSTPKPATVHDQNLRVPPGYVKKLEMGYDATTKRINKTVPADNNATAYLWDYNNSFPIAMATNSTPAEIAASSFESDGKGNFTYAGPTYSDISVKTGKSYYKLGGGNITKSLAAGTYKLEYWGKGTINLSGGTITAVRTAPADANGWIFYEKQVVVATTATLTVSGTATAFVDELRVYPTKSQMTTYTYDGANGLTSMTDPNNVITYYEYDSFGRLQVSRDQYGNIVKAYDYHFKGN